ncbi:MAG: periplasmic heavy metal sensor [Desulfomonile tiedjei]|uniref:Periplasmic heavy metal sensor n=1 Tax=Desulfomonile tiedjei TaxID=2358 RepID=A0A9D6V5Q0_9BACT|nr:periplasmic heavy metal sensor [Desulfomonile tiedjei]
MNRSALLYVLIFSLMLNAAVLGSAAVVWWKRPAEASESSLSSKSVQQFIKEELKLEAAKADELRTKVKSEREEIDKLRSKILSLRSELMESITAENIEPSEVESKLSQMDQLQFQVRRAGVGILSQVAQSLGPEDRKKFRAYLKERMIGCGPMGGKSPFGEITDRR